MIELGIIGLAKVAHSIFTPILENIAKDVAKDAAKSYVGKAFKNVFSVVYKSALQKATGLALKELLELIENELLDADYDEEQLKTLLPHVQLFIESPAVMGCFKPLFLDPDYHLDPKLFAQAWQTIDVPALPDDFSWQRISKRFSRKVMTIRHSAKDELKETFDALQSNQNADALKEVAGLSPDFDLDTYREALIERFGNLSFDSIDTSGAAYDHVRLWRVFVPQSVRKSADYHAKLLTLPKDHRQQSLQEWEQLEQQRRLYDEQDNYCALDVCADPQYTKLVILGDPGSGKSTLLQYLALQWARNEDVKQRYTQALPLLIELRAYNQWQCEKGKSFVSYLHHAPTWHRLNQHTVNYLLQQPKRVILLLDGLDEVFDPVQREQVINDIHRFSNDYKNTQIILTSRVVGYKAQRLRDAEFTDFMLQDLDAEQIEQFLQEWHSATFEDKAEAKRKQARLSKAIQQDNASIKMLAGNPLLLTMMAIINRYQELPRDRVLLYEKATEVLLQQWDTERGLADFPHISHEIDLRAKKAILRKIAYAMQTGNTTGEAANIIQGDALNRLIEDYLRNELHFQQARAAANALVRQLRERNFILCFVGADSYAFVHRTFLEYFCAADFVHRFKHEQSLSMDDLKALFIQHCHHDNWREVLRLICSQIDESFVDQLIAFLVSNVEVKEDDPATHTPPELLLATYCLSEVKNLSRIQSGGQLLLKIVDVFFKGKTKFPASSIKQEQKVHKYLIELISISEVIGEKWPQKDLFYFKGQHPQSKLVQQKQWFSFVCTIFKDKNTYSFLIETAIKDKDDWPRGGALKALARYWTNQSTYDFLTERAVKDKHNFPRSSALKALAYYWTNKSTYYFLMERAVKDKDDWPRRSALETLAKYWTNKSTYDFLIERAVKDKDFWPRGSALEALAQYWTNKSTYDFLMKRAVKDKDFWPRGSAFEALAQYWTNESTYDFLMERAVKECAWLRGSALIALTEYWTNDNTREFLIERVSKDKHKTTTDLALKALDTHWKNDHKIKKLIKTHTTTQGFSAYKRAKKHSYLGEIIFIEDASKHRTRYFNPQKAIPKKHINEAAKAASIPPEDLEKTIQDLSKHMGWDITKGSAHKDS